MHEVHLGPFSQINGFILYGRRDGGGGGGEEGYIERCLNKDGKRQRGRWTGRQMEIKKGDKKKNVKKAFPLHHFSIYLPL